MPATRMQHQRGEAVEAQVELDAEGRDPVDGLVDAGGDVVAAGEQPHERRGERDSGDDVGALGGLVRPPARAAR